MTYQHKRKPLSVEETNRFVNAAHTFQEKLITFTLLDTGLRVVELVGLTRDNILLRERRLVIGGSGDQCGKRSKQRIIPLTARVRCMLEHHFSTEDTIGMSGRTIHRLVKRVAKQAGITMPVSPYILRLTFGATCIRKGMSIVTVSKILGHKCLRTTMIYLDLLPEDVMRDFEEKW